MKYTSIAWLNRNEQTAIDESFAMMAYNPSSGSKISYGHGQKAVNVFLKVYVDWASYQYDFDKKKTTLRNVTKISKNFKIGKVEIAPYLSEEPFYDTKSDKITEHRATVGLACNLSRDISIGAGYMLNSKKGQDHWTYTNVLVTNLNIKF